MIAIFKSRKMQFGQNSHLLVVIQLMEWSSSSKS